MKPAVPALAAFITLAAALPLAAQTPAPAAAPQQAVTRAASVALRGEPLYGEGFTHFAYVNPDAPKGGSLTLAALGTYDNFHRYALRGSCADGNEYFYDTLMTGNDDEISVLYPLIARALEYPPDYSYVIFDIDPRARDQEGQPITAEDAAFSFNILFEKGVPQFRAYYAEVRAAVLPGNRVRFDLPGGDKEIMLSVATFPVFPRRFWEGRDFGEPLTEPPVGTGPYRVAGYAMGQYVVLERVKDYWAADLPSRKGLFNFDTIRYDYYRDANVAFEAFKSGEYDFREENSAKNWATEYKGKLFETGRIVREEAVHQIPQPTQALVFNIQRPVFSDRRVRRALGCLFDFEWLNKNLFYGQYVRTRSYFTNTEYAAAGLPGEAERDILRGLPGEVPPEALTEEYRPPVTDGTGNIRPQAREAVALLAEAGWELRGGRMLNRESGERLSFELLIYDTSTERFAIPFQRNLARYGIEMKIRMVDSSQYINRLRSRDFDMVSSATPALPYPSSDMMILFHSRYIDSTWNTAGVEDPAVDALTEAIAASQEDEARLLALGRAFDRLATWNFYMIPQWHVSKFRLAYAAKFGRPERRPRYAVGLDSWWVTP